MGFLIAGLLFVVPFVLIYQVIKAGLREFSGSDKYEWVAMAALFVICLAPALLLGSAHPDWLSGILGKRPDDMPLDGMTVDVFVGSVIGSVGVGCFAVIGMVAGLFLPAGKTNHGQ